jgi:hypothetical protein
MANFISLDLGCPSCSLSWDTLVDRAEHAEGKYPPCPRCGEPNTRRLVSAPAIMQRALPDGVRRKGFKEGAEAFRLESESYDMPPEKRGDINKEIKKLKEKV